jgi:hypothetical protein
VLQRTECIDVCAGTCLSNATPSADITHVATRVVLLEDPQSSLPESVRIIQRLIVETFTALDPNAGADGWARTTSSMAAASTTQSRSTCPMRRSRAHFCSALPKKLKYISIFHEL